MLVVVVERTYGGATTDDRGYVTFAVVPGMIKVTFSATGYVSIKST